MSTSPQVGLASNAARTPVRILSARAAPAVRILVLAAWCGLAGGWLEVATRVLCRAIDPTHRLYQTSRHFVWLAPLANLALLLSIGLSMVLVTWLWPRFGTWLGTRLVCAFGLLPALWAAGPRIYRDAWFILALGIAAQLVPWLERCRARLVRKMLWSLPLLAGLVPLVAGVLFAADRLKEWRESRRPLPPAGSPNVLLIVLDTVRADHLSLYGYHRRTSEALERLATQGIRFDEARATAPWTLPSHASMFTGRLPHELGVQWVTPLTSSFPTLAEHLGAAGYATAGFAANEMYCSYDTGLARGFTHYEDYILDGVKPLRTSAVSDRVIAAVFELTMNLQQRLVPSSLATGQDSWFQRLKEYRRRSAESINRGVLDWLSRRRQPERPFLVFLNYYDAHASYVPPPGTAHRFGLLPVSDDDVLFLTDYWSGVDKTKVASHFQALARDCYDNCVAYVDEQLGALVAALEQRGLLEQTLLFVTSDHGEGFGEHELYDHGESLYRSEIRVPLVVRLPGRGQPGRIVPDPSEAQRAGVGRPHAGRVVRETVSLRDLPATIVEQVGLAQVSPFPGRSLARYWSAASSAERLPREAGAISELESPNPANPNQGRSPAVRGPLIALADGDFVYIRNERDGTEQLFNQREDPHELLDRAGLDSMQPLLQRFRAQVDRMTAARSRWSSPSRRSGE
jgi:arylsulfatase A-like enzyme